MGTFLGVLGIMALAALLLGLWFWLDARRTVRRLDRMLSTAIDGGFGGGRALTSRHPPRWKAGWPAF